MSVSHRKVSNGMFNELCTCEACVTKTKAARSKETRKHHTLKDAVDLLAGIAHYTLRVERDSVTDSIEIGLETCVDLEEIVNRARLAAEASVSTWGTHWHASRGNLRVLHTCGDRCGKRSS